MGDPNPDVGGLLNIGPKSAAWLRAVGIHSRSDLEKTGVVGAYLKVRAAGYAPSRNLLYALEGALTETLWNRLPRDSKTSLLIELDAIEDVRRAGGE